MKNKRLLRLLGDIDGDYIAEAAPKNKKINGLMLIKPLAFAACFALILSTAIPAVMHFEFEKDYLKSARTMEYGNAVYEIIEPDNKAAIKDFNLPDKITADMIGEFVSLTRIDFSYRAAVYKYNAQTENEQKAVYIVKEENDYKFALFCNYHIPVSAQEAFKVYGVQKAADIKSITVKKPQKSEKILIEKEDIELFFNTLISSELNNEEQFSIEVFQRKPEAEQQAIAARLADERIEFRIETADGLIIKNLGYYPSIHSVSWMLGHYKVTAAPF